MLYQILVEKKEDFAVEAKGLLSEIHSFLGIKSVDRVRILNRYFVDNISDELFKKSINTVFSEPPMDNVFFELDIKDARFFAVEYLPGQFDQRADSARQCLELLSNNESPTVHSSKIYALYGNINESELESIKKYVVNPVEARVASLEKRQFITPDYDEAKDVEILKGFNTYSVSELEEFHKKTGLAMDIEDLKLCQEYFKNDEKRDPVITEIRVIDTYWSDHCRHTTFNTILDNISFEDKLLLDTYNDYLSKRKELNIKKPVTLMDMGTIVAKYLKKNGSLKNLDESDEINACTIKCDVDVDGKIEPYLILFKNETHNHPTEIEPFGGAATCIGGAIRDPLSGRAYVYSAMRLTGAGNPLSNIADTIKGKLAQRNIVTKAACGSSSYGNQIGLSTGIVDEIYHNGYTAKRMEVGAVIAATPAKKVRREKPSDKDVVVLIGAKTGRDGIGGATGSSKSHNVTSVTECSAEVQKGNAPEERKIQRLFRNEKLCRMIKKCNDFGAGGVSVAIGELADGLDITLDKIPKKYEGLDATELAISESQERMAVVIEESSVEEFLKICDTENVNAVVVARVKSDDYLTMNYKGQKVVNISRKFLDTNGAKKHVTAKVNKLNFYENSLKTGFRENYFNVISDINVCSKNGLIQRFDSTIGHGTVLMPLGGKNQLTPIQAMVNKVALENGDTKTCSIMSWGYNPFISEKSPYHGSYMAVIESLCKLIAVGASYENIYLSFQEYFEKLKDEKSWGKPVAALLGAYKAQMDYKTAAIGGKDSMSGTFEDLSVPPTLISFAVTTDNIDDIISPEFKGAGHKVVYVRPEFDENRLPVKEDMINIFNEVNRLIKEKKIVSAYTLGFGGVAAAVFKMAIGNFLGFKFNDSLSIDEIFKDNYGAFVLEVVEDIDLGREIGIICEDEIISYKDEVLSLNDLFNSYESKLESVYPSKVFYDKTQVKNLSFNDGEITSSRIKTAKPKVLIPVFPGTNCEYDSAKVFYEAGADAEIFVINNLNFSKIEKSIEGFAKELKNSQMVFIPGGFSAGDEPDGSGKFITAFFRNSLIKEAVSDLLDNRDGLMAGICNGFQALIKMGLLPYGKIIDTDENFPTLAINTIGRHQSMITRIRIATNNSPWLKNTRVGEIYNVPVSHGEGRFIANDNVLDELYKNGQIATQYVDFQGNATYDIRHNPNGSTCAIEGIVSRDGRVFGKMGHSERIGYGLYKNVYGKYDMQMFKAAVEYFK